MNNPADAVATRTFSARSRGMRDSNPYELRIEIFVPLECRSDGGRCTWSCSLRASGVIADTQTVTGLDSFQALESAFAVVVSWIIAASGNYELRPLYAGSDDASMPAPEALTLMHGLVSAGVDMQFHGIKPR